MNNLKPCPFCGSNKAFTAYEDQLSLRKTCVFCPDCGTTFANEHVTATGGDITVWWNNEVPKREKCHVKVGDHGDTCSNCGNEYDLNLLGSFGAYDGVQATFCPFCGSEVIGVMDE